MISIKKYLNGPSSSDETLRQVLTLLVQAIELHTVEGDEVDYQHFRNSFKTALKGFGPDCPPDQLLIMSGAVSTALREYKERTSRFLRSQNGEYQRIVLMLTDAVANCTQGNHRALGRLKSLETQLERAAQLEDVRTLRIELGQCLETLQESIRQQEEAAKQVTVQAERLRVSAQSAGPPVSQRETGPDQATGLLTRDSAEKALVEGRRDGEYYVLVFVIDKFQAIHARFGADLCDRILRRLTRQVQSKLAGNDRLYRWDGPTFVGVLARQERISEITAELARSVGAKFEEHVEVGNRSILLSVSLSWIVFPLGGPAPDIVRRIQEFAARQGARPAMAAASRG